MNSQLSNIAIVAGGMPPKNIPKADFYIGVDRGALWLIKQGVTPDIAIGDFDSVTKTEKRGIHDAAKKYIEFSSKKDATDLELAVVEAIKLHPKQVMMYGALGGRFDHSIGAVQILLKLESHNILGQIVDNLNKIIIVRHKMTLQKDKKYQYVSIIPFGSAANVTLRGFLYNIVNKKLPIDSSLGISNEIINKRATITVHQGCALVVQSRD